MVKCVKRDEIDVERWNHCVEHAHNGRLYALSFYLDCVCSEGTWMGLVLDDYQAVMPLAINTRIPFFPRIMLPHFAQQLGVFSADHTSETTITEFISNIPSSFRSVYLQFNDQNELPQRSDITIKKRTNYTLNLDQEHDLIFKNYSRSLRRNIRLAAKQEPTVVNITPDEFIPFYLTHDKAQYLKEAKSKQILSALLTTLIDKKRAQIYAVKDQGNNILAALVITNFKNRLTNLMACSSDLGRSQRVMHFLIDHIIASHISTHEIFDFEGSDIPNIAEFFASFGALETPYTLLRYDRFPFTLLG